MLTIHKSYTCPGDNGSVRLITPVTETAGEKSIEHNIWVEVDPVYEKYLCVERCDAMLLGLLHYALKNGHDIQAEMPVSRELYFNLTNLLLPVLCGSGGKYYHRISLQMEYTADPLPNAGAVGTGLSLGVDSFYTICKHRENNSPYPVTHLLFFNVGSHGRGGSAERIYQGHRQKVAEFAKEYNYELVILNSNYADEFRQHYFDIHAFAGAFAVFSLQKLWSSYFYASAGYSSTVVGLPIEKKIPCAYLMPLLNGVFMTETMHFRADAEGVSRTEKLLFLSQCEMAQKYLFVCTRDIENCCKCDKCVRTILRLRIIGMFNRFSKVFPAEKCSLRYEIYMLLRKSWKSGLFSNEIVTGYFKKLFRISSK